MSESQTSVGDPVEPTVMQHTPGPWHAKPYGVIVGGAQIALPGGMVQQQVAMVCTIDDGDRDANARLIAAAPNLLATLKRLRLDIDPDDWCGDERMSDMIDAAVAKAEGGAV